MIDCIKQVFLFTFPIGWQELGTIMTFAAVIVALYANRQARKQLKSALLMQDQSTNLGLVDKRIELMNRIDKDKPVSENAIRILFDESISKVFGEMQKYLTNQSAAVQDMIICCDFYTHQEERIITTTDVWKTIQNYERNLEHIEDEEARAILEKEFKAFCDANEFMGTESSLANDPKLYNYYALREAEITSGRMAVNTKNKLLQLMEQYISSSIAPLSKKHNKKGAKA